MVANICTGGWSNQAAKWRWKRVVTCGGDLQWRCSCNIALSEGWHGEIEGQKKEETWGDKKPAKEPTSWLSSALSNTGKWQSWSHTSLAGAMRWRGCQWIQRRKQNTAAKGGDRHSQKQQRAGPFGPTAAAPATPNSSPPILVPVFNLPASLAAARLRPAAWHAHRRPLCMCICMDGQPGRDWGVHKWDAGFSQRALETYLHLHGKRKETTSPTSSM